MHQALVSIRQIISKYQGEAGTRLYLGGLPMIVDDVAAYIRGDLVNFGAGVFVFLIIMLTIIFREVRWVVLPFASCIYAGTIMVGLLGIVGWKVTVIFVKLYCFNAYHNDVDERTSDRQIPRTRQRFPRSIPT